MTQPIASGTPAPGTPAVPTPATTAPIASPPAPPAAPPAPATASATAPVSLSTSQLDERLSRARATERDQILRELGVTDLAQLKTAVDAAKKAADSNKSAEERAAESAQRAAQATQEATRLAGIAKEHAARLMLALTAEQQEAIRKVAPDTDPAAQLQAIATFGPTWARQAEADAAKAASQPAANTAPQTPAPAPSTPGSPPDHRAVYNQMRQSDPFRAAAYGLQNPTVYDRKQ